MSRARDIADLVDSNGDIVAGALDNVPASNDASALTTGTLDGARLPDPLPSIDGSNLTGVVAFSSGTLMLFQQTSAPTGWTKQTTHNNKALRVVSGTAGSGGSSAFTTALGTPSLSGSTSSKTLSIANLASHNHTFDLRNVNATANGTSTSAAMGRADQDGRYMFHSTNPNNQIVNSTLINNKGSNSAHNHSLSGTASINVQYVDLIIASKD